LLVLAITLHNMPQGLAVDIAFGAPATALPSATLGTVGGFAVMMLLDTALG
jgi:ZIP family zinc transporter